MKRESVFGAFLFVLLGSSATPALGFESPAWRPADGTEASAEKTTYQEWNVFVSPVGPNTPDVESINPNGVADAWDTSGASFVTSGGNIYSPTGIIAMEATIPGYGLGADYATEFLLQMRTLGSELDIDSLTIDGVAINTLDGFSYEELDRDVLGGFGGSIVDHAFAFTAPVSLVSYDLAWFGAESSVSQDILIVDTRDVLVPEPAAAAMLGTGLAMSCLRRRRD